MKSIFKEIASQEKNGCTFHVENLDMTRLTSSNNLFSIWCKSHTQNYFNLEGTIKKIWGFEASFFSGYCSNVSCQISKKRYKIIWWAKSTSKEYFFNKYREWSPKDLGQKMTPLKVRDVLIKS